MQTSNDFLLLSLDTAGGTVDGKHQLQARAYLLSCLLRIDLGFTSQHFGPGSEDLSASLAQAKALGFVDERTQGFGPSDSNSFELRRCELLLTDDGKVLVEHLKQKYRDGYNRAQSFLSKSESAIESIGIANISRVLYLEEQHPKVSDREIVTAASKLGWDLSERDVNQSRKFLAEVGFLDCRTNSQVASLVSPMHNPKP